MKCKCVFFDRDGIVNQSPGPGYVERWEDFHLLPEFVESAKIAAAKGYAVAIATNQRGVAGGIMTQETLVSSQSCPWHTFFIVNRDPVPDPFQTPGKLHRLPFSAVADPVPGNDG